MARLCGTESPSLRVKLKCMLDTLCVAIMFGIWVCSHGCGCCLIVDSINCITVLS